MRKTICRALSLALFAFIFVTGNVSSQQLSDYIYKGKFDVMNNAIMNDMQFNGYTNHWWNDYKKWYRYGNLYKISIPDVEKKIVQARIDIAEDMKLPGFWMQEGFIMNWLSTQCTTMDNPSTSELSAAVAKGNVLVITSPSTETGKILLAGYPGNSSWKQTLKSYQFNDPYLVKLMLLCWKKATKRYL